MSEDYIPFGPEWEKDLMKLPKKAIINLLRINAQKRIAYREKLKEKVREDIKALHEVKPTTVGEGRLKQCQRFLSLLDQEP